jgi:hypothetical protein
MRDHHDQQFVYWSVPSVVTGMCLPNRCPAMDYSASTRCHANKRVLIPRQPCVVWDSKPLPSNGRSF